MPGLVSVLVAATGNGLYLTLSKLVLASNSPVLFGFFVMGLTALVIGSYIVYKFGFKKAVEIILNYWVFLVIVGFFSSLLNFLNFAGLIYSSAINSAIINRLDVFFTALLGGIFFGERLQKNDWLAVLFMMLGVFLVLRIDFSQLTLNTGDIFFLISTFLQAVNAQFIRYKLTEVPGPIIAFCNTGICTTVYLFSSIFLGYWVQIQGFAGFRSITIICGLLFVLQLLLYYGGLKKLPTWLARALYLVAPVVGTVSSILLLKENFYIEQLYGMLLVGIGVIIISLGQKKVKKNQTLKESI